MRLSELLADSRFFKITTKEGEEFYLLYGNVLAYYQCMVLGQARYAAELAGDKFEVVGDLYPLDEPSDIPQIQKERDERLRRERKKGIERSKKHGYQLSSVIKIGKYKGKSKTIQWIIQNDKSYWNWLLNNNVLLLHPEVTEFCETL